MNSRFLKYVQTAHILKAVRDAGSFSGAAKVLDVQQSAISHRVKALEDALGARLFNRSTRSLVPTAAGARLCESANAALLEMEKSWNAVERELKGTALRLSTVSSIAMKWLIPLMADMRADGLDIILQVQDELSDLTGGEADVAIRFGIGPYPGLHTTHLRQVSIQPVASHAYLEREGFDPARIGSQPIHILSDKLAELDDLGFSWKDYFARQGNAAQPTGRVSTIDRTDLSIQAALNGVGVALGRSLIIEDDIRNGRLVAVDAPQQIPASYWLVTTMDYARTRQYRQLESWLKTQISEGDYL